MFGSSANCRLWIVNGGLDNKYILCCECVVHIPDFLEGLRDGRFIPLVKGGLRFGEMNILGEPFD